MKQKLYNIILTTFLIFSFGCQNVNELDGNYSSCTDGFYSEVYFMLDSMRVASDTNGEYLSEWRKIRFKDDTLYFETFGEWRDSSKGKLKFINRRTIEFTYSKHADSDSFNGVKRLDRIKENLNFNSINDFWLNFKKRKSTANCKNK